MFGKTATEKLTDFELAKSTLADLARQRTEAQNTLGPLQVRLQKARADLTAVQSDLQQAEQQAGRRLIGPTEVDRQRIEKARQKVDEARQEVNDAEAALQTAENRVKALRQQEQAQQRQVENKPPAVAAKDLQAHRKELDKAAAEVERLTRLIEAQTGVAQSADDSDLHQARQRRANVLADLAEGHATEADLTAADKACSKAEVAHREASALARRAQDTIEALQPRLQAAQARQQQLGDATSELTALYLRTRAEEIGGEFVKYADALAKCYVELVALESLLMRLPGHKDDCLIGATLEIAAPAVSAARDRRDQDGYLVLVDETAIEAAIEQEQRALSKAGIAV